MTNELCDGGCDPEWGGGKNILWGIERPWRDCGWGVWEILVGAEIGGGVCGRYW